MSMAIPVEVEELRKALHALTASKPLPGHEKEHEEAMQFLTDELFKVRPELGGTASNLFKLKPHEQ